MRRVGFLIASCLTAFFGTAVSAATVSFNVSNNWTQGSLAFTASDGTIVTADGSLYDNALPNPTFFGNPYIASWSGSAGGIGICSGDSSVSTTTNSTSTCSDNHQVDGNGSNEAVIVSFGNLLVDLVSVTFAYVGDNDDYEIFLQTSDEFATNLTLPDNCWVCTVSNFNVGADTTFAFGAYYGDDDWKLYAVEFTPISVIPLPASGLLLVAGLGALALQKRRKSRLSAPDA